MSRPLLPLTLTAALMGGAAFAEVPRVVADIAPVHSLVAQVMDGVGTPDLVVQAGASPHEYALRPSEASALQSADIVFWIGPDLTPWLTDALTTLAPDAQTVSLMEAAGTKVLPFREDAVFEAHDHGAQEHADHEDGTHKDHDDHDHDAHDAEHDTHEAEHEEHADAGDHDGHKEDGHEEHGHDEHGHEGHNHGAHDPHVWLSPSNASEWLNLIAAELSAVDPENAGSYFANAAAGRIALDSLKADVSSVLEPARGHPFVVFHDAYQYFEDDFDFPAAGALSISDASDPSPARLAQIRERISGAGVDCVLTEPQFNPGLITSVLDGTDAQTGVLDPLGSDLEVGPTLYPNLIRNLATTLAGCL